MIRAAEVHEFVQTALECSVYVAPTAMGLTHAELYEAGKRLGFQEGEVGDAIAGAAERQYVGDRRLQVRASGLPMWDQFHVLEDPDFRNVQAFDFVCGQLRELARSRGIAAARIERTVFVARAEAAGLQRLEVEVALAILVLCDRLIEEAGVLRFAPGQERSLLASEQLKSARRESVQAKEMRARVHPVVRDIVARRTDGRSRAIEPLGAFAEALQPLGYGRFRLWWTQTVAELRVLDPSLTPVAVAVLSAALVEGALTFVVKHARASSLGVFRSKDFDGDPRSWKIDNLVASAATGNESAILDVGARHRAESLIKVRQRIHAGRMLSEFPSGIPDLRPEEAQDARATVDLVVRRVLDWLEKFPPRSEV